MKVTSDMSHAKRKRVIIVTGASRGLGKQIALLFGRKGDKVVVNYLSAEQQAADVVKSILDAGGEAFLFKADVRQANSVEAMTEEAYKRWGSIDVLVNNAGRARDSLLPRMTEQGWDDVLDTNLKGPFHTIRAAAKIMIQHSGGHIINISSIVALKGRQGQANYSSSKAALIGLTRACASELGRSNIKINAVLPGYMNTDMGSGVSDFVLDRVLNDNTLGRFGDPVEVAEFIYHLSLMRNVSGQVFNLDSRVI